MAIQWTERLAVGVPIIDDQHKELFDRVNRLLAAAGDRSAHGELPSLLGFLQDYVVTHFRVEEDLMARHFYPDAPAHKEQHAGFVTDFGRLRADLEARGPEPVLVVETQKRVVDWLLQHVGKTDKVLGAFLADKA